MSTKRTLPVGDILFALLMIVLGATFFVASLSLPPPALEPVGPAAFPQWVSIIQILLSLVILWRSYKEDRHSTKITSYRQRYDLAMVTIVLVIAYFSLLELEWMTFQWATVTFIFFLTAFLFDWKIGKLPIAVILALGLGLGLKFTFTEVLYLDLP